MNCLLVSILVVAAALGNLSEDEVAKANKIYSEVLREAPIDHRKVQALSDSDRELMIRYMRAVIENNPIAQPTVARDLAMLGDEWGMQMVARKIRLSPSAAWDTEFHLIRNAKMIPLIGDLLSKNERYVEAGDLGFFPAQWVAATGIITTLRSTPQVLPDVGEWAREMDAEGHDTSEILQIVREWYAANEEKLRAGDFLSLRPGRWPSPAKSIFPLEEDEASPPRATPAAPPSTMPAMVSPAPSLSAEAWIAIAAGGGACILALSLWRGRRKAGG